MNELKKLAVAEGHALWSVGQALEEATTVNAAVSAYITWKQRVEAQSQVAKMAVALARNVAMWLRCKEFGVGSSCSGPK